MYGYLTAADGGSTDRAGLIGGLRGFAEAEGFCYVTTFGEPTGQPQGVRAAFDELVRELIRADAHDVAVPCLAHLTREPDLLARLTDEADARLWLVDRGGRYRP